MKDGKLKTRLIHIYEQSLEWKHYVQLRAGYRLHIMSAKKTLRYIRKNRCSIARYGDGELSFALNIDHDISFQKNTGNLSEKLRETLQNSNPSLLLCMPIYLNTLKGCTLKCKRYWWEWGKTENTQIHMVQSIRKLCGKNYVFGDSLITRPYMDRQDIKYAQEIFDLLKALWQNRDILIVEGEQTRLGVGNDLFDCARSVKRILAPAVGAFEQYEAIRNCVIKHHSGELVLLALGPAATVLAADLASEGIQALDIGHVDIEYEWFLSRQTKKVAVAGKYTNELVDGRNVGTCTDQKYMTEVLECIGCQESANEYCKQQT